MSARSESAPWWNETVTVFHQDRAVVNGKTVIRWERFVFRGCFCGFRDSRVSASGELRRNDRLIVRIPASDDALPALRLIGLGDVAVRGMVGDAMDEGESPLALRKKYGGGCFIVNRVVDNTKLKRTAHFVISEEAASD